MKKIYKFFWDCGRQGDVDAIFVADEEEIKSAIGKQVYFGEILGKHSEVCGTLDQEDIEVVNASEEFVNEFERLSLSSGRNPLNYISS